jgi:hypothetical protein
MSLAELQRCYAGHGLVSTVPRCMADVETQPTNFPYACLSGCVRHVRCSIIVHQPLLDLFSQLSLMGWGKWQRTVRSCIHCYVRKADQNPQSYLRFVPVLAWRNVAAQNGMLHHGLSARVCLISGCCRSVPCNNKTLQR